MTTAMSEAVEGAELILYGVSAALIAFLYYMRKKVPHSYTKRYM